MLRFLNKFVMSWLLTSKWWIPNIVNITSFKSALIFFFEESAAISFQYHVNTHDIIINDKNIIASMMFTLSRSLNLIFKRAIRELHHTRCSEIKNFLAESFSSDVAKRTENSFLFQISRDWAYENERSRYFNVVLYFCHDCAACFL